MKAVEDRRRVKNYDVGFFKAAGLVIFITIIICAIVVTNS